MKRPIILFTLMVMFAIGVQAQIVGANEGPKVKTDNTTSSLYKPTGHYLRFEAGAVWGSVAYDYQINPYIMVGGGIGICGHARTMIPVYAEAIFSTPHYKWSFYTEVKIGYDVNNSSFLPSLTVGTNYKNFGLGIGCYYSYLHNDDGLGPRIVVSYKLPLKVY